MKTFAFVFFLASTLLAAAAEYLPPLKILMRDGELVLSDTSSYFVFARDGIFRSFPVGQSGRELTGKWTAKETDPSFITVTAEEDWINGMQSHGAYRKIVFVIYGGSTEPNRFGGPGIPRKIYRGYFIIEEFTKIPKPK